MARGKISANHEFTYSSWRGLGTARTFERQGLRRVGGTGMAETIRLSLKYSLLLQLLIAHAAVCACAFHCGQGVFK